MDSWANVYVADSCNYRIQKFTSDGAFITKWGSYGSGDGQFDGPYGVAVDTSGNVYVPDAGNHRIEKFTSEGVFITKWGGHGSDDGEFGELWGVAVDRSGNVYVADSLELYYPWYGRDRIQKFTSDGVFITEWGRTGWRDGEFCGPRGVAVEASRNVCVTEPDGNCIHKFTSDGLFVRKWGSCGNRPGQFDYPLGVAVDPSRNV